MQNQKGNIVLIILGIVSVSILAGGVGYFVAKKPTQKEDRKVEILGGDKDEHGCIGSAGYSWCNIKQKCLRPWEEECKSETKDEMDDWKTYTNLKDYYEIKYNSPYRVWLDHNLVNYNGDDPKYERGNPDGVKIQIQKHSLNKEQTFIDAITEMNNNIKDAGDNASETQIEKYNLGDIKYANKILSGPGGKFDIFYSLSNDGKSYFSIAVWNIDNDKKNVNLILSTFKATK